MRSYVVALAAFLSAGSVVAEEAANWKGFYVGAHAGYAWGDATTRDDAADWGAEPKWIGPFDYDVDGAFGGATAGVNWQYGALVLGLEADLGYMDLTGSQRIESSNPAAHQTLEVDGGWYALLGGRAGFAFGKTLVYGKGGYVWLDTEATQTTTNPGFVTHGTDAHTGWAYGGGIEHALGSGWSLKAEYLHFDFDTEFGDQTRVDDGYIFDNWTDLDTDTVKVGINYHFNGPAPVPLK